MNKLLRLIVCVGVAFLAPLAIAAPPQTINYQGVLTTGNPAIPVNGPQNITFRLYDAVLNGNLLWTDNLSTVPVTNGVFNVVLGGSITSPFPPTLVFDKQYFLSVEVNSDGEMSPRQALQMVPYAYRAVVADGLAISANIAGSQVTGPIANASISGNTLSALDARYAPSAAATTNTVSNIDAASVTIDSPSIVVPGDGLPVISYTATGPADTWGSLKAAKCSNAKCSSGTTKVVDSGPSAASQVVIGSDGLPTISYYDPVSKRLKVAKCGNATCASGNTITVVDSVGDPGELNSIVIGTDGLPLISYNEGIGKNIKFVKCGNAACSSGNVINVVDSYGPGGGGHSAVAVGSDGLPVITYSYASNNFGNSIVKVAKCTNPACSTVSTNSLADTGRLAKTAIMIGTDGLPLILHTSGIPTSPSILVIEKCGNDTCSSGNLVTNLGTAFPLHILTTVNIAIGPDGSPVVFVGGYMNSDPRLAQIIKCGNPACTSGNTVTAVDGFANANSAAFAIDASGLPVVAYTKLGAPASMLFVVKCNNATCSNITRW